MDKNFRGFTVFDSFHENLCARKFSKLVIPISLSSKFFKIGDLEICQNWSSTKVYVCKILKFTLRRSSCVRNTIEFFQFPNFSTFVKIT